MSLALVLTVCCAAVPLEQQLFVQPANTLSQEAGDVPGGAFPGGHASKCKLLYLFNTPMAAHDGRLIAVYGDASSTESVWSTRGGVHAPQDVFVRFSDDEGATWSDPVNLSGSANSYSALCDWDGDGAAEPYWGDSDKPNVFSHGDVVVVSWVDKYAPEPGWTYGDSGQSALQGRVAYPDLAVYPNQHHVPYSAVYAAVSGDGGTTWLRGGGVPPLQLTYARRDAKQDVHRGNGKRWVMTWQEDPEGLQPGEADGPGEGASGAKTSKGTDIWYTFASDVLASPDDLISNRTPISNHSGYDTTRADGYPTVGTAGGLENHAASRANLGLVKDGAVFKAVIAYEETKGVADLLEGKIVHYHAFPFDAPPVAGAPGKVTGVQGVELTPLLENARRVRFVTQGVSGTNPAIGIFWRQGVETEGGAADILMKVATTVEEADVAAAPTINLSTNTPEATPDDLLVGSTVDPIEDARAHRAVLRGSKLMVGYTYTWNGPLARYTDLANYDFWVRRSVDGGQTWGAPENLSKLPTQRNVKEPRLVPTPNASGGNDTNAVVVAWGTETNVYEGVEAPQPLDLAITRTKDFGASYEPVVGLALRDAGEFESQLRSDPQADRVYAVWMEGVATTEARYATAWPVAVPDSAGTLFCFGSGDGTPCPCGNDTGLATGCASSVGTGAVLFGTGSTSASSDDLSVAATGLPVSTVALLIASDVVSDGGFGIPFSDGLLCLEPPIRRLLARGATPAGEATWPAGIGTLAGWSAGDTGFLQVWYRNSFGPCGQRSNTTNGLTVVMEP